MKEHMTQYALVVMQLLCWNNDYF